MAKKKKIYVEPKQDLTVFLFTSLMLILLTFFIVLTSMGVVDDQRKRLAMNSLMGSFGILPGGTSAYQSQSGGGEIVPQSAPLTAQAVDIKQIRATLRDSGNLNGTGVSEGALGIVVTLRSNILFDEYSDNFLPGAHGALDALARVLEPIKNPIIITGHTDSVPIEDPPFESNWGLSSARALRVLEYLETKGVADTRMAAYGMGSQRPISSNDTAYGRRLNRRVEVVILGDLPGDAREKEYGREEPARTFQYKGFDFQLEEM